MAKGNSLYNRIRGRIFKLVYPAQVLFRANDSKFQDKHARFYAGKSGQAEVIAVPLTVNLAVNLEGGGITTGKMNEKQREDKNKPSIDACILVNENSLEEASMYDPSKQIIIVASDTCYEDMDESLLELVANKSAHVFLFNPKGVGMSPGTTYGPEDYQKALSAIIDNLIYNKKIRGENIVVVGHGLGATMASEVVLKYQTDLMRIKLISDKPMHRIDVRAGDAVRNFTPFRVIYLTFGTIFAFATRVIIRVFGLNADADRAVAAIEEKNPTDVKVFTADQDNSQTIRLSLEEFRADQVIAQQLSPAIRNLITAMENELNTSAEFVRQIDRGLKFEKNSTPELRVQLHDINKVMTDCRKALQELLPQLVERKLVPVELQDTIEALIKLSIDTEAAQNALDQLAGADVMLSRYLLKAKELSQGLVRLFAGNDENTIANTTVQRDEQLQLLKDKKAEMVQRVEEAKELLHNVTDTFQRTKSSFKV